MTDLFKIAASLDKGQKNEVLRDHFAERARVAFIHEDKNRYIRFDLLAARAYAMADEMMKQRKHD